MPKKDRRKKQVTPERLMEMSAAYGPPLVIGAAANNRVFDSLKASPKSAQEMSKETGASARGLRIVMNALVGLDLLKKDRQGKYSLTPESAAFLVSSKRTSSSHPSSMPPHHFQGEHLVEVRLIDATSNAASRMQVARYFATEPKPGEQSVMGRSLSTVLGIPTHDWVVQCSGNLTDFISRVL